MIDMVDTIGRFIAGLISGLLPLAIMLAAGYLVDRIVSSRASSGKQTAGWAMILAWLAIVCILYMFMAPTRNALRAASCKGADDFALCMSDDDGSDGGYDRLG